MYRSRNVHGDLVSHVSSGPMPTYWGPPIEDAIRTGESSRPVLGRPGRQRSCAFQSTGERPDGLRQSTTEHDVSGARAPRWEHVRLRCATRPVAKLRIGDSNRPTVIRRIARVWLRLLLARSSRCTVVLNCARASVTGPDALRLGSLHNPCQFAMAYPERHSRSTGTLGHRLPEHHEMIT